MARGAQAMSKISDLFGESGWYLQPAVVDRTALERCHQFLEERQGALRVRFEKWSGEPVSSAADYAQHQTRLATYEARGLAGDLRHYLTGEFDLETRLDLRIVELLGGDRVRDFVSNFLRTTKFYVHYPPMVRFKLAEASGSIVPPHQDAPYNTHMRDFMTVWMPLVDIDEACGGVIVSEGSHRAAIMPHEASGAWAAKAIVDGSAYPRRHVLMSAGDVLLFPPTLLHESARHTSPRVRYSLDFRVFREDDDSTKSLYDPFARKVTRRH